MLITTTTFQTTADAVTKTLRPTILKNAGQRDCSVGMGMVSDGTAVRLAAAENVKSVPVGPVTKIVGPVTKILGPT